jgi:hypothetical protein
MAKLATFEIPKMGSFEGFVGFVGVPWALLALRAFDP